jgi:hypothetical protein
MLVKQIGGRAWYWLLLASIRWTGFLGRSES